MLALEGGGCRVRARWAHFLPLSSLLLLFHDLVGDFQARRARHILLARRARTQHCNAVKISSVWLASARDRHSECSVHSVFFRYFLHARKLLLGFARRPARDGGCAERLSMGFQVIIKKRNKQTKARPAPPFTCDDRSDAGDHVPRLLTTAPLGGRRSCDSSRSKRTQIDVVGARRRSPTMALYTSMYAHKALTLRPEGPVHDAHLEGERTVHKPAIRCAALGDA